MTKPRILVVEDERVTARIIQYTLERLGYSVAAVASSGDVALSMADQTRPDLVLMDIDLKGDMDGIEAARLVQRALNIPIVYLTANTDDNTRRRAVTTEPYGYILKPFKARELQTTIEIALYKHALEQKLKEWVTTTLRSIGDAVVTTDEHLCITFLNPAAERLLETKHDISIGKHLADVLSINSDLEDERYKHPVATAIREGVTLVLDDHATLATRAGKDIPIDASIAPVRDHKGNVTGAVLVFRDITERVQAQAALEKSEERYALAAQGANDGLWDWDLTTDQVYFSPRWKSMLGLTNSEVGQTPDEWLRRVHPDDRDQLKLSLASHVEGLTHHFESEHRMRHRNGTYRWMLARGLAVRDAQGTAYRMAGSLTDITDRKRAEEQLLHDALHDALTGLPNRALFMDRLGRSIERARRRNDYSFAVLFLDLDRFKLVNDSLGHVVGDRLLKAVAPRLAACLRGTDTVARLGGDEFTILLEDIRNRDDAKHVAERIQELLTHPFSLEGHEIYVSASIGIVLNDANYDKPEDVLRDADIAMYHAKALGKTRYEMFDASMRADAVARLELETDLRRAVEQEEFVVQYQPIVSLETGRITGFEALVRWQHPKHGLIPPAEFIPIAEETGLINSIGRWILKEACYQARTWQRQFPMEPPLTVSVNLSPKQFTQPDLLQEIETVLDETGLDARSLRLEITESIIMEDTEAATATLSQLRARGIQVQIDDFGTGYSSLSYLHQFPIDTIKIDRTFISRMGINGNHSDLVETIVALAHVMALNVVAEGIETAQQLAHLRALKCEHGQGFVISRPLDGQAAAALISGTIETPINIESPEHALAMADGVLEQQPAPI